MTNKELRDYLAKWPDDSKVLIVAVDPRARQVYHTATCLITDSPVPLLGIQIEDPEPFTEDMIRAAEEDEEGTTCEI